MLFTFCKRLWLKNYFHGLSTLSRLDNNCYYSVKCNTETKTKSRRISKEMKQFFEQNAELSEIMQHIPAKYLGINSNSEHHYLVSSKAAKDIADRVMYYLDLTKKQLIAETNAGLGLITIELLERGVNLVRMYESCPDFRRELKDFGRVYNNRVELFTKDIYHVSRYNYMDKQDRLNRVETLFQGVPKRSWTDDPVMTIIGPMNGFTFLYYLVKSLALQTIPATYGRIQTFALMKARDYAVLSATNKDALAVYRRSTILFNLLFDIECLGVFPKNIFLPWVRKKEVARILPYKKVDLEKRYLVRINFKKNLPIEADKILQFVYFLRQFYISGDAFILPKLEKWLPGSGLNLIHPKLKHTDHFKNFSIFTKFRELNPQQTLAVFREMVNHPGYKDSSFMEMVEHQLLESETIDTDLVDAEFENKFLEDFEEKLNYSTDD